jgi:hypothetical protein
LRFQFGAFLFQQILSLRRKLIQHAGRVLADLAKLVIRTLSQLVQRFQDGDDFHLQHFVQPIGGLIPKLFHKVLDRRLCERWFQQRAMILFSTKPERLSASFLKKRDYILVETNNGHKRCDTSHRELSTLGRKYGDVFYSHAAREIGVERDILRITG